MHILVVEDEVRLARHVSRALLAAGHDVTVMHDGETGLRDASAKPFDLVVLDVMLPGLDGFEVLRRLRKAHVDSRVLILTARGELNDRVNGLSLGADDYLAKPFAMQELTARVSALGRRYAEKAPIKLEVSDLSLDLTNNELHRGTRRIELSVRELTLLRVLMREPGRVLAGRNFASASGNASMNTT
ncbi:MAG: response regulator transcription factor [Chthoniobacterales bacterium]|nr:response regulator transcription factor [Chthoniobacterales bacterium]